MSAKRALTWSGDKATNLMDGIYSKVKELYELFDTLKEELETIPLEFPQVIVVGQESAGKSSVLERICMQDIFPRDVNLCTRMPIELHLQRTELVNSKKIAVKIKFNLGTNSSYESGNMTSINEIHRQIKKCIEMAKSMGLTDYPLIVEIKSPIVPNLKLVDLPGVIGNLLKDEPSNIVEESIRITKKYINMPHTIIVAVVDGTLKRVRNDRPIGLIQEAYKEAWTIGVLTHIDDIGANHALIEKRCMGQSDEAPALGGGYVPVVNRDTASNIPMSLGESRHHEMNWFKKNIPNLHDKNLVGADLLIKKIMKLLKSHVRSTWIPHANELINKCIEKNNEELGKLGEYIDLNHPNKKRFKFRLNNLFNKSFRDSIKTRIKIIECFNILNNLADECLGIWKMRLSTFDTRQDWYNSLDFIGKYTNSCTIKDFDIHIQSKINEAYIKIWNDAIAIIIKEICEYVVIPIQLRRFPNFKDWVIDYYGGIWKAKMNICMAEMKNILVSWRTLIDVDNGQSEIHTIRTTFRELFMTEILIPFIKEIKDEIEPPDYVIGIDQNREKFDKLYKAQKKMNNALKLIEKTAVSLLD